MTGRGMGLALSAVAALAVIPTVFADWGKLEGQEAPPVEVGRWLNPFEGQALEDLRGKAVLLEFWATW